MSVKIEYLPTDESSAREFLRWKYASPYEIYNYKPEFFEEDLIYNLDPSNNIFSMYQDGKLVGYCSFGQDAQVPGGDCREQALDIGLMIKPELTGQGLGTEFVRDVIQFATTTFKTGKLRVTILTTNLRAQRVWEKNGFLRSETFNRKQDQLPFVILTKDV